MTGAVYNLSWAAAAALARAGAWVRRLDWEDRWFFRSVALWWVTSPTLAWPTRVVQAEDFTAEDRQAEDWTTLSPDQYGCVSDPPPPSGPLRLTVTEWEAVDADWMQLSFSLDGVDVFGETPELRCWGLKKIGSPALAEELTPSARDDWFYVPVGATTVANGPFRGAVSADAGCTRGNWFPTPPVKSATTTVVASRWWSWAFTATQDGRAALGGGVGPFTMP